MLLYFGELGCDFGGGGFSGKVCYSEDRITIRGRDEGVG